MQQGMNLTHSRAHPPHPPECNSELPLGSGKRARKSKSDLEPVLFLELVPLPDDRPWHLRLKAAMKTLLRRDALRCRAFLEELPVGAKEIESPNP